MKGENKMAWIKRETLNTVPEIVMSRTGMSLEHLLNDTRKYHYQNMKESADLAYEHIRKNSKIRVYGDYDVDGICSIFILETMFMALGYTNVEYIAPRRFSDGYGINVARVKELYEDGCNLIITIDNGIAALEAIQLARKLGMDVIILDHHNPFVDSNGEIVLPEANIIVDPHVTGGYVVDNESHEFEDLCGAGLGYYFAREMLSRTKITNMEQTIKTANEITIAAGIATVADLVELVDDNRRIVKSALSLMSQGFGTEGLRQLMEELNIHQPTSTDIAFGIGPCLNASGRLYDNGAEMMVNLLSHRELDEELHRMVSDAKKTNDDRKDATRKAEDKAETMMLERGADSVIVLVDDELNPGIAGLVSSSLTETYNRPSIVLTKNAMGICKGSGRSIPEVNLKAVLDQCQELLLGYGGHPMAAGVSLKAENVDAFREKICSLVPEYPMPEDRHYDIEAKPDADDLMQILKDLNKFEPYGQGNEAISIMIPGIELGDKMGNTHRMIGGDKTHVKFMTKYDFDIIWFNGAGEYELLGKPKKFDIICNLGVNVYKGKTILQAQVRRLRPSV